MAQPKPKPQPKPGAPAAGAGGQKAAGTAVPPKQPKPAPAPKPPKPAAAVGTQPAAGRPTQPLAQRPGQAPRPLNVQQQTQVQKAAQGGTLDQYMASHPGVAQHYGRVQAAGTAGQQGKYQTLQQQNQAAKAGQPGATGAPAQGAGGGKPNAPAAQPTPAPTPPPADTGGAGGAGGGGGGGAAAAPTTFEDAFNAQYGQGAMGQFGPPAWTGPNPIETARAAAQRGLQEDLAGVRARYAGSGFGNSAREALAEGQATGDFATKFGDIAAQRAEEERQTGLDRLANMFGTAGAQQLQGQQIGLEANQQLANLGTGITGIGAQEQGLPNQSDFITLLTNMGLTNTLSQGAMRPPKQ